MELSRAAAAHLLVGGQAGLAGSTSKGFCSSPELSPQAQLPLEDELSSDGDDIESSWKHYLVLARQAADKADALGEEYISRALDSDLRIEELSLREEEKRVRTEAELEKLQAICGTAIESGKLLEMLSGVTKGDLAQTYQPGASCDAQTPCDANAGYVCIVGACVRDPAKLIALYPEYEPELQRLVECIGTRTVAPFVAAGNVPLCLWRGTANPTDVCTGATTGGPCPDLPTDASSYASGSGIGPSLRKNATGRRSVLLRPSSQANELAPCRSSTRSTRWSATVWATFSGTSSGFTRYTAHVGSVDHRFSRRLQRTLSARAHILWNCSRNAGSRPSGSSTTAW